MSHSLQHPPVYTDSMMNNKELNIYLNQISRFQPLTKEEEFEIFDQLAEAKNNNDTIAIKKLRNKILNANLKFVVKEAKNFMNKGIDYMDLICAGNIGLTEAVDHFDASKNVKFITYAVWWIDEEMRRAICETGRSVKIPVNKKSELNNSKWIATSLSSPVATGAGMKNSNETLGDKLEDTKAATPEEEVLQKMLSRQMEESIKFLKPKQKAVLTLRYGLSNGESKTLREIATSLNFSKERVRQLEQEAICSLKDILTA